MIVPENRLLFWTGFIVLPFSAVGALYPSYGSLSVISIASLCALVLLDIFFCLRYLNGISVELPEVVRMTNKREGSIDLRIINESEKVKRIRLALAFPEEIVSGLENMNAVIPGGSLASHILWHCTPWKRGRYMLKDCFLEGKSLFGFWALRRTLRAESEIRVYPSLLSERKDLSALFMNHGSFGIHAKRQVGQGRDFEKLREYIRGDSYEHIHWKVTAKRGRPVTKVFQIEKTQQVYIILDTSRLSARRADTSPGETLPEDGLNGNAYAESVLDRFVTSTLVMGVASERQGDHFGILSFSNKINHFVRAGSGRSHFNSCRDILYNLASHIVAPDFDELFSFLCIHLRKRALLVFLTNLDDPVLSESFVRNLHLVKGKHLVLVNMLRPEGARPLFSDSSLSSVGDVYRELGGHILLHDLLELQKVMKRLGVRFSLLDNEMMCNQVVSQYMELKQRQMI